MARRRKSGCGIWLLFWIIIFLVILLIILQNKGHFKNKNITEKLNSVKNYILKLPKTKTSIKKYNLKINLYFVKHIQKTDQLALIKVSRKLKKTSTPLSETLRLLLDGPTQSEEKAGITSVFWANTKLKDIKISNKIAYLNFNPEFETGVGISMLQARLYQVVYTATQFPEVDKVKILINGKAKSTFSSEGLSIKHPLNRLKERAIF